MSESLRRSDGDSPGWLQAEKDAELTIVLPGGVPVFFRRIPEGEFRMGSSGRGEAEEPVHLVKIKAPFYLGTFPVTQEQYRALAPLAGLDPEPSWFKDREGSVRHPVERVNWDDAMAVCRALTAANCFREALKRAGLVASAWQVGLPSEAMWEWACRAGKETDYWNGDGEAALAEIGIYRGNSGGQTQPVDLRPANPWGLHDMHGNVWEWCADVWDGKTYRVCVDGGEAVGGTNMRGATRDDRDRVVRGGSWNATGRNCRSAARDWHTPGNRYRFYGFRLCVFPGSGDASKPPEAEAASSDGKVALDRIDLMHASFSPRSGSDFSPHNKTIPMTTSEFNGCRALSSENGSTWQQSGPERKSAWPVGPDHSVVKLVLGRHGDATEGDDWTEVVAVLETGLKDHFPNLTHLYVWGLPVKSLGPLPESLVVLDVRKCGRLDCVEGIPATKLKVLLICDCPALSGLPLVGTLETLEELHFRGLPLLGEEWIHEALGRTTQKLWKINLSGCGRLAGVPKLKVGLKDLRINDCPKLKALPSVWPPALRRLELANTPLTSDALPPWVETLDYVNMAGMSKLTALPEGLPKQTGAFPRTLFLFGSGVRQPPAIMHGKGSDENVAESVCRYFQQGGEVGFGSIRRCKLLFLGNGQAGKTSLALSLEGDPNPTETAKRNGSTHGIRLQSQPIKPLGTVKTDTIRLDHWDFGGQEIYHNAHAKFVQAGSLFLVVWYPEQDGKDKAVCPVTGYEDTLHPLRYWLDLVSSRTSGRGRVLIVASHCGRLSDALLKRCNEQRAGYVTDQIKVMANDAETGTGQLNAIVDWVGTNAGNLVEAEGENVPIHWKIAEDLVNRWLSDKVVGRTRDLSFEQFRDDLAEEVKTRVKADEYGEFAKLAAALEKTDGFRIDDEITRQTLHVLTNLGALYWSEELFDRRVIVGQDWALRGIYAALDRTVTSQVFRELQAARGRFTRGMLSRLVWKSDAEYEGERVQNLLISFMEDCQICFRLSGERWDGYRFWEPEFVSIKHLPTLQALRAEGGFAGGREFGAQTFQMRPDLENKFMNDSHWHAILADLGRAYGNRAEYALDGFYLPENEKGQAALVRVEIDTSLEGNSRIFVETSGPEREVLKQEIINTLIERLPDKTSGKLRIHSPGALKLAGDLSKQVTLFISYARNTDHTTTADQYRYEDAINAIEERLGDQTNIRILRDRNEIRDVSPLPGSAEDSNVVGFMEKAANADFVLLVHSAKYWKSQYCMFEAWKSYKATSGKAGDPASKFLLLDQGVHAEKKGAQRVDMDGIEASWRDFAGSGKLSAGLTCGGVLAKHLSSGAVEFLVNFYPTLLSNNDQRMVWDPLKLDEIVGWIVRRCGFLVANESP